MASVVSVRIGTMPTFVLFPEQPRCASSPQPEMRPPAHQYGRRQVSCSGQSARSSQLHTAWPVASQWVRQRRRQAARTLCHVAHVQDPVSEQEPMAELSWSTTAPVQEPLPFLPLFDDPPAASSDDVSQEPAGPQDRLARVQAAGKKDRSLTAQSVQWYPGHIARAERQLKEQLKMVDVVLEVRDARIPVATHHPQVAKWVGPKPRLLVINRQDQISPADKRAWTEHYKVTGQRIFWTHGKLGDGVKGLRAVLNQTSDEINAKRAKRGLAPRPVRACVIGFPNIGKSALINRLLGRKAVASAARPGVTRMLQWVRLSGQLDLLDAPGVIPASFSDQVAAQRLAVCNDIGEAAYRDSAIAAAFIVRCKLLPSALKQMQALRDRYGVDPEIGTAEDFIVALSDKLFFGDQEAAGARILKDYRSGFLGNFALELPSDIDEKRKREVEEQDKKSAKPEKSADGFSSST